MTADEATLIRESVLAALDAMTPQERRAFVLSLTSAVDRISNVIVDHADEIWESRHDD